MTVLDLINGVAQREKQGLVNTYHGLNPFDKQGWAPPPKPNSVFGGSPNVPWDQHFKMTGVTGVAMNGVPYGLATPSYNPYLGNANFRATPMQPTTLQTLPLYLKGRR